MCGLSGTLGGSERDSEWVAPKDGVDPVRSRRDQDSQASHGQLLSGAA